MLVAWVTVMTPGVVAVEAVKSASPEYVAVTAWVPTR